MLTLMQAFNYFFEKKTVYFFPCVFFYISVIFLENISTVVNFSLYIKSMGDIFVYDILMCKKLLDAFFTSKKFHQGEPESRRARPAFF